jgi:hypothetical protein
MDVKGFNLMRAEEERRKAATANNDAARDAHRLIAEIFESRAAARDGDERRSRTG